MSNPEILLLESDAAARERLESLLRAEGFAVRSAESLAEAEQLAKTRRSRLLLTNLLVDDGPAFDFAGSWTDQGGAALGMTSVYRGPSNRGFLVESRGLVDVLEQPVDAERLVRRLRDIFADDYPETAHSYSLPPSREVEWDRPAELDIDAVQTSGSLERVDIAALLARLGADKKSGALMLQSDRVKKLVYLENGVPVGVKSNLLRECLGQMLVGEGRISASVCDQSVEEMRRTRRQQGEVLIAMGHLTQPALQAALERQLFVKLKELLTWRHGVYKYKDAAIPAAYHGAPSEDVATLIWRAVEDAAPIERVEERLAGVMSRPVTHRSGQGLALGRLGSEPEVRALLERIDDRRPAVELIESAADSRRALLLLYALTAFGEVAYLSAEPAPSRDRAGGPSAGE